MRNNECQERYCSDPSERKGGWLLTYTGKMVYPLDPRVEEICIEDIAHALSLNCRYTGHVREFYSVAQHSILVASLLRPKGMKNLPIFKRTIVPLYGLLHDASEAYLHDMPSPLKYDPTFGDIYRKYEADLTTVILNKFGLFDKIPEEVFYVDSSLADTEMRDLCFWSPWRMRGTPLDFHITPIPPRDAEKLFLEVYEDLRII